MYQHGPTKGSLLIYDNNNKLIDYKKNIAAAINDMSFNDLTNDGVKEILIKSSGAFGIGLYGSSLDIFQYNNKYLKKYFKDGNLFHIIM